MNTSQFRIPTLIRSRSRCPAFGWSPGCISRIDLNFKCDCHCLLKPNGTLHSRQNVGPDDGDEVVSVGTRRFMEEPGGMHHLVDDYALLDAAVAQGKHLPSSCPADLQNDLTQFPHYVCTIE